MSNSDTCYVPTKSGWKPVSVRLLESKGFYTSPPVPCNRRNLVETATGNAESGIRDAFRGIIAEVIDDGQATIPEKLKKIETLLKKMEADIVIIRSGGSPPQRASKTTESIVRRLQGKGRPQSTQTTESVVERLLESKRDKPVRKTITTNEFVKRLKKGRS